METTNLFLRSRSIAKSYYVLPEGSRLGDKTLEYLWCYDASMHLCWCV